MSLSKEVEDLINRFGWTLVLSCMANLAGKEEIIHINPDSKKYHELECKLSECLQPASDCDNNDLKEARVEIEYDFNKNG